MWPPVLSEACAHLGLEEPTQHGRRLTWQLDFSWAERTLAWHVRVCPEPPGHPGPFSSPGQPGADRRPLEATHACAWLNF